MEEGGGSGDDDADDAHAEGGEDKEKSHEEEDKEKVQIWSPRLRVVVTLKTTARYNAWDLPGLAAGEGWSVRGEGTGSTHTHARCIYTHAQTRTHNTHIHAR